MRNFEVREPKVEVITNGVNPIVQSWVDSRSKFLEIKDGRVHNHMTDEDLGDLNSYTKEVMKMDLAVNYFETATFKMTTSVLIRDFFYTFQEYKGKWATTQRYSTQSSMVCSSELDQGEITDNAFEKFIEATNNYNNSEAKGNFDRVRELMPLAYQVNYQLSMPVKQFIKYLAVLLKIVGRGSEVWKKIYGACYVNESLRPWLKSILKYSECDEVYKYSYNDRGKLSSDEIYQKSYTDLGNIGSVLYSQLIRHEDVYVTGYPEFMKDVISKKYSIPNCSCEFLAKVQMSPKRFMEIMRIRTEWFAVTDDWQSNNTWAKFLRTFIPEGAQIEDYKEYFMFFDNNGNFDSSLVGKHDIDDSLRLHKGYNAYYPNAFQLESRKIVEQRIERYGMNPLLNLYLQIFDKGYVKDNPNNPDRIKWESITKE